jgi:hypothetical protein
MRSRLWVLIGGVVVALAAMVWWSRPSSLRPTVAPTSQPVGAGSQPAATQPASQPAGLPAAVGTAVVQGRVVDPEGRPIAGARVVAVTAPEPRAAASSQPSTRDGGRDGGELGVYAGPLPFPDEIAAPASGPASGPAAGTRAPASAPAEDREVGNVASATDGTFVMAGLPATRLVLRVTHGQHPCGQHLPVSLEGGGERSGLQITLARGVTVTGRVTDARGNAVGRAVVAPEFADSVGAQSDAAGSYRFGPVCGRVRLVASAPGLRSQARQVEPAATDREVSLDFRLERDAESLRGRVVDHRDRPVGGVSVTATGTGEGRPPAVAVSGPRGEFVLGGLGPGPYRLETRHESYPALRRDGVQPGEDVTLRLPAAGGLAGLVREERAGAAVPVYELTITPQGGGPAAPPPRRLGGKFEVKPLAPGTWRVAVRAPGYVPFARDVEVAGGDRPGSVAMVDLLVELQRGAVVSGEIRDDRGDRVAGASVSLGHARTRSGPRGEFRLGELPAGEQVLHVRRDGYEPTEVPVVLRAGDETRGVDVRLTRRP